MPLLLRQFNHLLKEGKGGRTSNSSRRFASTLVEETIPEDSQVILFCPILIFFFKFLVEEIIPED